MNLDIVKVLIKKYNNNPDLTTNITPDASFNLFKFTGKYEKRPKDNIYNSLLKPMTKTNNLST